MNSKSLFYTELVVACLFLITTTVTLAQSPPAGDRGLKLDATRADASEKLGYWRRFALVVGASKYDPASGFSTLRGPNLDASEVASVLASRFGFEEVTLVVDGEPAFRIPRGVNSVVRARVTKQVIVDQLDLIAKRIGAEDALVVYFAGHGMPLKLVPGDAVKGDPATMLQLNELVKKAGSCNAHHVLFLLDCCFSGAVLEPDHEFDALVGDLSKRSLERGGDVRLSRVFNRRSFQVITAGGGGEPVGDVLAVSERYAHLVRDVQGHSPFTGSLLQAMQGMVGRPDGVLAASELGYRVSYQLINEVGIEATQAPRFGWLGKGEGDLLLIPAYRVLNPEFIAPLYRAGDEHAQFREAACYALLESLRQAPAEEKIGLVRSVLPHLMRVLEDPSLAPRHAAARVLGDLGTENGAKIEEFAACVGPLAKLLEVGLEENRAGDADRLQRIRFESARALGSLGRFATKDSADRFQAYVEGLAERWKKFDQGRPIPDEVAKKLAGDVVIGSEKGPMERVKKLETRRVLYEWLNDEGQRLVSDHQAILAALKANVNGAETQLEQLRAMPRGERVEQTGAALDAAARLYVFIGDVLRTADSLRDAASTQRLAKIKERVKSEASELAKSHYVTFGVTRRLGDPGRIRAIAVDPSGRRLIAGGERAAIWDLRSGEPVALLVGHTDEVTDVAATADGRFVTASKDGTLAVWDQSGKRLYVLAGHTAEVTACRAANHGSQIVSASSDESLRFWDAATGKSLKVIEVGATIRACCYSSDDSQIVTGDEKGTIRRFQCATGDLTRTWKAHQGSVTGCLFLDRDTKILSTSEDGSARIWNLTGGAEKVLIENSRQVTCCGTARDGSVFGVATYNQQFEVYEGRTMKSIAEIGIGMFVDRAVFLPDGRLIAATHNYEERPWDAPELAPWTTWHHRLAIYDWKRKQLLRVTGPRAGAGVSVAVFSPDRNRVLTISGHERPAELWATATGKLIRTFSVADGGANCGTFSADGREVAIGTADGIVQLWDSETGHLLRRFAGSARVRSCAITGRSGRIVSVGSDGLRFWDRGTGRTAHIVEGNRGDAIVCAADPVGDQIVCGYPDGAIRVWSADGRLLKERHGSGLGIHSAAFSPGGRYIISGNTGADGSASHAAAATIRHVSDMRSLKKLDRPARTVKFGGDGTAFESETFWQCAISKELLRGSSYVPAELNEVGCRWVLTASEVNHELEVFAPPNHGGALRLWEPNNARVVRTFAGHGYPVKGCAFNSREDGVISLSSDAALRAFPLVAETFRPDDKEGTAELARSFEEVFPGFEGDPQAVARSTFFALRTEGAPWGWGSRYRVEDLPKLQELDPPKAEGVELATTVEQERFGTDLLLGRGMPAAARLGRRWLQVAAEQGHVSAAERLAWAVERNLGADPAPPGYLIPGPLPQERVAVERMLLQSRQGAGAKAIGVAPNESDLARVRRAVESNDIPELERAADRNEPDALITLARLRPDKAEVYLRRAAALGDPPAMVELGHRLKPRDAEEAVRSFQSAAILGSVDAFEELAKAHAAGRGTYLDLETAENLRKIAERFRKGDHSQHGEDVEVTALVDFEIPEGWSADDKSVTTWHQREYTPEFQVETDDYDKGQLPTAHRAKVVALEKTQDRKDFVRVINEKMVEFRGNGAWRLTTRHTGGYVLIQLFTRVGRHEYCVRFWSPESGNVQTLEAFFDRLLERLSLGDSAAAPRPATTVELRPLSPALFARHPAISSQVEEAAKKKGAELLEAVAQILAVDPDCTEALRLRAKTHFADGRMDLGLLDVDRAIVTDPDNVESLTVRARIYQSQKDYRKSLADLGRILELEPDNYQIRKERGDVYFSAGDLKEAVAQYSKAIEQAPSYSDAYYERAWTHYHAKDYNAAIADYDVFLTQKPNHSSAYRERGDAYLNNRSFDKARADFDRSLELDDKNPAAYLGRGKLRMEQQNWAGAISDLALAAELDPKGSEACLALARLYCRRAATGPDASKDQELAVDQLEKLRLKGFRDWTLVKEDKRLELLRANARFLKLVQPQ